MTLSRRATFAAASLLSAVIAMPTAALADKKPSPNADSASDKDQKHGDHRSKDHGKDHDAKKSPQRGGQGYTGNAQPGGQPPARGFGNAPPPKREHATQPKESKPPVKKPPVINAAPKTPPAPPKTLSKDRAPTQSKHGDHGKPRGDRAGDNDNNKTQRPGGKPDRDHAGDHKKPDRNQASDNDSKTRRPDSKPDRDHADDHKKPDRNHAGDNDNKTRRPGGQPYTGQARDDDNKTRRPDGTRDARHNLPRPPSAADARKRFDNLRKSRTEKVEGNRTFIKEGDRTIVKQNNRYVIQHDERERLRRVNPNARFERGKGGRNIAVIDRPGNVKIYSETDSNGHLIRRYRRGPDGRDVMIIDNRRRRHGGHHRGPSGKDIATGIGIGIGVAAGAAILNSVLDVPPPRVRIPRDQYIVEYDGASDEDVYDALSAPPVEELSDRYTLDEVRATATLRDRMRRVDLDDVTFEFGSWEVDPSEYSKLERVARAMKRVIRRNPNEVFMIEGYTDAVGSPEDNLSLSDRRAESVAEVLSEEFEVPFENLVTQGYGEDYLKVQTEQPERLNRRVAVRRITPLLARGDASPGAQEDDDRGGPPEEHYEPGPPGSDPD